MANLIKIPGKLPTQQPNYTILMKSGYYSPPRDCIAKVHVIGGGGGSRPNTNGGGGGYAMKVLRLNAGSVYNVTIGAGGSGGTSNTAATNGGNTSFQSVEFNPIIGYGGGGGVINPSPSDVNGGLGGKASGGDINREGQHGHLNGMVTVYGKYFSDDNSFNYQYRPAKNNYMEGTEIVQGLFGRAFGTANPYSPTSPGSGYGGIGSGARNGPSSSGNGGQGVVIVEEF